MDVFDFTKMVAGLEYTDNADDCIATLNQLIEEAKKIYPDEE